MKKAGKIFLGIFAGIIIIIAAMYLYVTQSSTIPAYLNIESGEVNVNTGKAIINGEDGMKLKESYIVKTGEAGEASVILYESIVISLDPNTEISISELSKENIEIKQTEGSTWTKFMNILGVNGMSIETPNTVATVRGTNFGVDMFWVYVDEGLVNVKTGNGEENLGAGENAMYDNGTLTKGMLTEEQKQRIIKYKKRQILILQNIRMLELEKKRMIIEKLLNANNLSFEEMPKYLEDIDKGEGDLNKIMQQIPVKIESAEKVLKITEKIREERKRIAELEGIGNVSAA